MFHLTVTFRRPIDTTWLLVPKQVVALPLPYRQAYLRSQVALHKERGQSDTWPAKIQLLAAAINFLLTMIGKTGVRTVQTGLFERGNARWN